MTVKVLFKGNYELFEHLIGSSFTRICVFWRIDFFETGNRLLSCGMDYFFFFRIYLGYQIFFIVATLVKVEFLLIIHFHQHCCQARDDHFVMTLISFLLARIRFTIEFLVEVLSFS